MLTDTLNALIQEEIEKGIQEFNNEFVQTKLKLDECINMNANLRSENNKLALLSDQINSFSTFKDKINNDNIEKLFEILNLDNIDINFNGMHSEKIPNWFRLICTYHKDKDITFAIFDMFNIKYPSWAKTFKLPLDYGEEELDLIFKHIGKMYVCNGEIFSNNMGFYHQYQMGYKGNINELFRHESYVEIPWNLLLQNKLLSSDKYFNKILDVIRNKRNHSEYFFAIQEYQELNESQVDQFAQLLPINNLNHYHGRFISQNKDLFKTNPNLAEKFIGKISDNRYSTFYYLNYPVEVQKEYIKKYKGYDRKFNLIKEMDIPKDEKLTLLKEIASLELDN